MSKVRPSFAKSQDGELFAAFGDRPLKSWDGVSGSFRDVGVPKPSDTLSLATSGSGEIVGDYYAYQRWLDDEGRVSSLSPVSSKLDVAESSGDITDASNGAPIVITSDAHGLSDGDKVKITGVLGNDGANGTWTVQNVTTDTFELADSQGSGDYQFGGTWQSGVSTIEYSNFEVPTDSRVVKRQILRNTDGQTSVFYIDVEDESLSGTTASSTNKDSDFTNADAVSLFDTAGNDLNLTRHGEPPSHKRCVQSHNGRIFLWADHETSEGCIGVTNGSDTVNGYATEFTSSMEGWELYVVGSTKKYTVDSVDADNQTLTLTANYTGSDDPIALYTLKPDADERLRLYWSESSLTHSYNPTEAIDVTDYNRAGDPTACMSHQHWLYLIFENLIQRLTFSRDPNPTTGDGSVRKSAWRGCVNQHCWVITGDHAYLMDRRGIYRFSNGVTKDVTGVVREIFQKDAEGPYKIDWSKSDTFHAVHYPEDELIKWFVSLGEVRPRTAICYQYRHGRISIDRYPRDITSSDVDIHSRQVYLGSEHREVLADAVGHYDGVPSSGGTRSGTVTSSGFLSITDSSATFDDDVIGAPLNITAGTGVGQRRRIVSYDSGQLNIDTPWTTKPDTTSEYQVGGIEWTYATGWFRYADSDDYADRGFEVVIAPQDTDQRFVARVYHDRSESAETWRYGRTLDEGDGVSSEDGSTDLVFNTEKSSGLFRYGLDAYREHGTDGVRHVSLELAGVAAGDLFRVYEVNLWGVKQ